MQSRSSEAYGHHIAPKRVGSVDLSRERRFPGGKRLNESELIVFHVKSAYLSKVWSTAGYKADI